MLPSDPLTAVPTTISGARVCFNITRRDGEEVEKGTVAFERRKRRPERKRGNECKKKRDSDP